MADGHGGAREGAGRKRTRDKYETEINAAECKIADKLPAIVDNLLHLANGGYERVKEKLELSEVRDENGCILRDRKGDPLRQLVVVERTVEIADKDRAANEYLLNRILGRPTEHHEHEFTSLSDEELIEAATQALGRSSTSGPDPSAG
jgi:hypothetical protein